jgi:hypothetical protein
MRTKVLWTVFLLLSVITLSAQKNSMTNLIVATFNIRMDTPNDNLDSWKHRKDMVNGLIRFHDFDVFGIQEGFHHQIMDILEPGGYDYVGVGRDDGKDAGEHSAIIYKKERLLVLDEGNFWLSETPDVPGKGWDATCCNRICSWAKFKDIHSNESVFNSFIPVNLQIDITFQLKFFNKTHIMLHHNFHKLFERSFSWIPAK